MGLRTVRCIRMLGDRNRTLTFTHYSHHPRQREARRSGTPDQTVRYYHLGMDGVFLAVRIDAGYRPLGEG